MKKPISIDRRTRSILLAFAFAFTCMAVIFATQGFSRIKSPGVTKMQVLNETHALEIVGQETTPSGNLRIRFKNISANSVNGFVVAFPNGGQIAFDTSTGDRVISSGSSEEIEIPYGPSSITILAVMFADGTIEGNGITVAELKQSRAATKAELQRGLFLLKKAVDSADADTPMSLDNLESAISNLSPVNENSSRAGALRDAKYDLLNQIQILRSRQQRNARLNQRELIRALHDRIERRIAGL